MKRKFIVQFEMIFDDDESYDGHKDIKALTCRNLKKSIDAGFEEASCDFFGEDLCLVGLETPTVLSVKEVKLLHSVKEHA